MARFKETVDIRPAATFSVDMSSLANRLDSFSQQQATIHAQNVAQKSFAEGQTSFDGGTPDFKEEKFFGKVKASSYNKGLRAAYVASIDKDNRQELARITAENPDNLTKFNDEVTAYRDGVLNSVDPTARPLIQDSLDSLISSNQIRVQTNEIERTHKENDMEIVGQIDAAHSDALGFARDGDGVASAESTLALFAAIDERVAAGFINDAQAENHKREVERSITEESFLGGLERSFIDSGEKVALEGLNKLALNRPKGFAPQEWDSFISRAQSKLSQMRSRSNAAKEKTTRLAAEALSDYEKANSLGFSVAPSEVQRVDDLVSTNDALKKRFDISNNVRSFSLMSSKERNSIINDAQTGQIDDVDQFAAIVSANKDIQQRARKDGLTLAYQQNLLDRSDLSLGDPDSFGVRVDQAREASIHYGVPVSPLTDQEATSISAGLSDMTIDEKIALATTFQESPEIWRQLSDKQSHVFAMAGATGDQSLMGIVFSGQDMLDQKQAKAISPTDYLNDYHDHVGDVYLPEDGHAVMKTAIAYYAATSENKGGKYDRGDFRNALEAVTGGIGKINGYKLELPRGVSEDDFDDFIEGFQPSTIEDLGGVYGRTNEQALGLIRREKITNIPGQPGFYVVRTNNGDLMREDGELFVIEWDQSLASKLEAMVSPGRKRDK